ncbi:hypothetical protein QEN19_002958 [Hanseniaspora menglaensis]
MHHNQHRQPHSPVALAGLTTPLDNDRNKNQNKVMNSVSTQQQNLNFMPNNFSDMYGQQSYINEQYSPLNQHNSYLAHSNNYSPHGSTIQSSFNFTPANPNSHRSSAELDYNSNVTRSFSNQSDFSNRLSNAGTNDLMEASKKFSRNESTNNISQIFEQPINPVNQFYRSGSVNDMNSTGNQIFMKNNSSRSSQNISYNPVASFYSSTHLNGTAILDEEDFGNNGADISGNASFFNQTAFNRRNSQGTLMNNYLTGRTSTGSVGYSNGTMDNIELVENTQSYNYVQPANSQLPPNQFRSSFGQQSATSSGSNQTNNVPSQFLQSEVSLNENRFSDHIQPNYGRSSCGSNYSSGHLYSKQTQFSGQTASGFIPDFIQKPETNLFFSHSDSKISSPEKNYGDLSEIHIGSNQKSTYQSRKTSTSSTGSNRPLISNTTTEGATPVFNKKNSNGSTGSKNRPQTSTAYLNNNMSNNLPPIKCNTGAKGGLNSFPSTTNAAFNTSNIHIKPPVDQDVLISSVKGTGLFFNEISYKQEVSKELQNLYDHVGINYFSQELVFNFISELKNKLNKEFITNMNCGTKLNRFVKYLISSNEQYALTDYLTEDKTFITSQGKQLTLVALKNGKLELLSVNKQFSAANNLQAKNLIIIDGDRGIDLAMVVEPNLSFPLAVLINFLKKKIHFDSLITDKENHYKNSMFISAILAQAKHVMGSEPLLAPINPKLYDLSELTQLIIPSKQVVKFATTLDVTSNLYDKFQEELKALKFATTKLNNLNKTNTNATQTQLDIKILNSEYQFDKKKLTFYYVCEKRNDFRDLIKELFKFYKTRIWLCAIPNNLDIYQQHYFKRELSLVQGGIARDKKEDILENKEKPFDKVVLDNFQISVYVELLSQLF